MRNDRRNFNAERQRLGTENQRNTGIGNIEKYKWEHMREGTSGYRGNMHTKRVAKSVAAVKDRRSIVQIMEERRGDGGRRKESSPFCACRIIGCSASSRNHLRSEFVLDFTRAHTNTPMFVPVGMLAFGRAIL